MKVGEDRHGTGVEMKGMGRGEGRGSGFSGLWGAWVSGEEEVKGVEK
jgi:hypothetical protein